MPQQRIEYEGKTYEFPDDFTDDEIAEALASESGDSADMPRMSPMASHSAAPPERDRTWADTASDVGVGVGKGLLRTAHGLTGMVFPSAQPMLDAAYGEAERPRNTPQRVGSFAADLGTSFLPVSRAASAVKAAPAILRGLVNAGTGSAVSMAQGHSPVAGAVGGAIPEAGQVAVGLARRGAQRILGGVPAEVAESALRYKALPGVIRTGDTRANARMGGAVGEARKALAGAEGNTPVGYVAGKNTAKAVSETRIRPTGGDEAQAVETANDMMGRMRARRPSRDLFESSERARTSVLGKSSPAANVERGFSADARARVGQSAPSSASALKKIDDLAPVLEAYKRGPRNMIDTEGANFGVKLLLSGANRVINPAVQRLFSTGTRVQSPEARAALIEMIALAEAERAKGER